MTTAALHISGCKFGGLTGPAPIGPLSISNATSTDAVSVLSLTSGANTVTVPSATAVGCVLIPPAGNATSLTLKGAAGDTGVPLHLTNATVLSFPAGTASLIIQAGGSLTLEICWF